MPRGVTPLNARIHPAEEFLWTTSEAQARQQMEAATLAERQRLLQHWSLHPWNWLSGVDTTNRTPEYPAGRPILWTKSEGELEERRILRPFPHKRYIREFVNVLADPLKHRIVLLDKCRQMMASWTTLLYIDWECRFRLARRWLVSKVTEDDAVEILTDKVRFSHSMLPLWVRTEIPVISSPQVQNTYPRTGSYIMAVAENTADRECRGGTASGILIDEAARQRYFSSVIAAAQPMASRIIGITTADIGNVGARTYKMLLSC